jgi:hypothetical protein
MDPVNRRSAWRMIERMKRRGDEGGFGCAIVLTTHSMAEAERLSDRIAIMGNGRLVALGNALHLKSRFGEGYRISVVSNDVEALRLLVQTDELEAVREVACDAGSLVLSVPRSAVDAMANILRVLEMEAARSCAFEDGSREKVVCEWSLSHATLEEVFLRLTDHSHFMKMDGEGGADSEGFTLTGALPQPDEDLSKWQRLFSRCKASLIVCIRASQALASKNITLQRRRSGELLCQIATPILVIGMIYLLQLIVAADLGDSFGIEISPIPYPLNSGVRKALLEYSREAEHPGVNEWSNTGSTLAAVRRYLHGEAGAKACGLFFLRARFFDTRPRRAPTHPPDPPRTHSPDNVRSRPITSDTQRPRTHVRHSATRARRALSRRAGRAPS